jgi:hypothetical protein
MEASEKILLADGITESTCTQPTAMDDPLTRVLFRGKTSILQAVLAKSQILAPKYLDENVSRAMPAASFVPCLQGISRARNMHLFFARSGLGSF